MAEYVPDWVHAPLQQGYFVKERFPDGIIRRVAFGEKGFVLFGRNGQVLEMFFFHMRVAVCVLLEKCRSSCWTTI